MNKRIWLNLSLLALVLVLAAVAYFKPGVEEQDEPIRLTALVPHDVERLEIRQKDGTAIALAREDGTWMIERPIAATANEFRIDPLLNVVRATSYSRFPADNVDLAQYGLAPPLGVLKVGGIELRFGTTEPIDHRRYVQVGNIVHLIADDYYYRTQSQLANFVSNRLLPAKRQPVKIELPDFTATRAAEGVDWELTPAREGVEADAVNTFVDEWRQAQAIEVSAYPGTSLNSAGQDKIEVTLDTGERREFLIVARNPELILARKDIGMQYRFAADQGERLLSLEPQAETDGDG